MAISKEKRRVMITLPEKEIKEIEKVSNEIGVNKSTLIQVAIYEYLIKYNNQKKEPF